VSVRDRETGVHCVEEFGVGGTIGGVKLIEDALFFGKARIQLVSVLEIVDERAVDLSE
jgi:hypothetical protein